MKVGKIGRVAVLKEWRNKGIGKLIMKYIETDLESINIKSLLLHAQIDKLAFYKNLDYTVLDENEEPFDEDGILHKKMGKPINPK